MAIVRWSPGLTPAAPRGRDYSSELDMLRKQMIDLFDGFADGVGGSLEPGSGIFPPLNISEDDDSLYVTTELPGIAADAIEVTIENDKLIIRGERKIPEIGPLANYYRREREAGSFRRVISLPKKIEAGKVTAASQNGILEITLPKAAEAKPRQIDIKVA